ncbi:MAG: hypothetical protein ACLRZ6_06735 [Lachnospiraceae bacterium]
MLQSSAASFSFIEVKGSEELWKPEYTIVGCPLDINERLDWLLEALNLDENAGCSTLTPEVRVLNPKYLSG